MTYAENVYNAIKELRRAESWAAFARTDPGQYAIASYAIGLLHHG